MAIQAMRHLVVGQDIGDILQHPAFLRHLTSDSRWLDRPERARSILRPAPSSTPSGISSQGCRQTVWRLVADMSAERSPISSITGLLDGCSHRDQAVEILPAGRARARPSGSQGSRRRATPATPLLRLARLYDEKAPARLAQEAVDAGFDHIKMKSA